MYVAFRLPGPPWSYYCDVPEHRPSPSDYWRQYGSIVQALEAMGVWLP